MPSLNPLYWFLGFLRAIQFNRKLAPHIIQFLERHVHKYFGVDNNLSNTFNKIILERGAGDIEVLDHLGKLLNLMGQCVVISTELEEQLYDTDSVSQLLQTLLKRIDTITVEQLGLVSLYIFLAYNFCKTFLCKQVGKLDHRMSYIGSQYLNCLEAIMDYAIWSVTAENNNIQIIVRLFKHHTETMEQLHVNFYI